MDKKQLQNNILEAEYNRAVWFNVLKDYFSVKKLFLEPKNITVDKSKAEYAVELGSFVTADEREVGIFEIKLQPQVWIERNRVGLRSLLRQVYKYDVDGALIVFQQDHKWRFSYVSEIRTEDGKKETEPKRYTYLFGKGESCRTAAERFDKLKGKPIHLNDLYDAFSVEKLNKDFFKTYKEFNEKFWKYLAEPKNGYRKLFIDKKYEEVERQEKPIRDFTKKLLGRIVFLHFLQKKGWMGVPATNHEWKDGDARFMQNLFANCKDKTTFHSKVLKTLFFKTLNSKRENDLANASLGKNIRIPYLNGGLFDKDISFDNEIDFPAEYFSGLLDFFEQYNFTIDENDPYDSEVGIDPEMLGHIFENLLEENREKGAFYTPKEIVHYMCQESLLQYLRTHLPECTEDDSPATIALQNFIRKGETGDRTDRKNFVVQQAKRIEKLLDNVKVCDPAIGSGAFPMGMLQEIYKAKTALDLTLDRTEVKKRIIQDSIYGVDIENGAVEIARLRFWLALVVDETEPQPLPNLDYKIMQGNSLLESFEGVDLSSLGSADNKEEQDILFAQKGQYEIGVEFSKTKQSLLVFDQKSKTELYELIDDYFNYDETTNTKYKSKQFIKDEINRIVEGKLIAKFYLEKPKIERQIDEVKDNLKIARDLPTDNTAIKQKKEKTREKLTRQLYELESQLDRLNNIIDQLHELQTRTDKPYFLWHLWFKEVFDRGGFDIVIGNPPYVGQKGHKEMFQEIKDSPLGIKYHQRRMDLFYFFFHHGIEILKNKGILSFITTNYYLTATYADKLRKHIYEDTTIISLANFNELKIFESAQGQHNLITILKKGKYPEFKTRTLITNRTGLADEIVIKNIIEGNDEDTEYNFQKEKTIFEPVNLYIRIESQSNTKQFGSGIHSLLDKVKDDNDLFGKYFNIEQGIVSGADKVSDSIINEFPNLNLNKGEGIFILTEEEVKSLNISKEDFKLVKPIYKNSDLKKWYFKPQKKLSILYLKDEGVPIKLGDGLKKHFEKYRQVLVAKKENCFKNPWLRKIVEPWLIRGNYFVLFYPRNKESFEQVKIVNSRRSYTNSFALEDQGYFEQSDIVFSTLKPEFKNTFDIKYFLAILNSKLLYVWFYYRGKRKGEQLELFQKPISEVPIKIGDESIQSNLSKLTTKIIELKKDKLSVNVYENKIDALVFHLYGLAENEMMQVLDSFKDLSIKDRNQIQNEYWNIANNKFKIEA